MCRHSRDYVQRVADGTGCAGVTAGPLTATVWVRKGRAWLRIPAPAGKLLAASTSDDGVYVLIEGTLWFRSLPDPGC